MDGLLVVLLERRLQASKGGQRAGYTGVTAFLVAAERLAPGR